MATRILFFFFFKVLLLFLALSDSFSATSNGQGVGINYGQIANNLPSPARVAVLLRSLNITRVKLYDADPNVLSSFSNSQVDFMIGLGNEFLQNMSTDPTKAQSWIQQRLQPHITKTRITSIVVGNEIFKTNDRVLISSLLPAMKAVYSALTNLGLEKQVTVTSAHSLDMLHVYPCNNYSSFHLSLTAAILFCNGWSLMFFIPLIIAINSSPTTLPTLRRLNVIIIMKANVLKPLLGNVLGASRTVGLGLAPKEKIGD